jgi:hypothetical protein
VLAGEGRTSFLGQYLQAKDLLHDDIHGHVENRTGLSRRKQLEAYDNCARLRPLWDQIAAQYDLVVTPSVVDEAPLGLENTGDMVRETPWRLGCTKANTFLLVVLFHVDNSTRTRAERNWL